MTEQADELVRERYGSAVSDAVAVDPHGIVERLLAHTSVRAFADEPVDDATLRTLVAAAQSASSSSHQQTWSVVAVRDPDRIRELVERGRMSPFAASAPMLLVFVADWARAADVAAAEGEPAEAVDYLESTLVAFVDAGIAAQNAVVAAEALGLGACYLGSLRNDLEAVADVLGLPPRTVGVLALALGTPASDRRRALKPRLPQRVVLHEEHYRPVEVDEVRAYSDRMDAFYEALGRPQARWIQTQIARVRDVAGLHGRERMRAWLEARGLPSR